MLQTLGNSSQVLYLIFIFIFFILPSLMKIWWLAGEEMLIWISSQKSHFYLFFFSFLQKINAKPYTPENMNLLHLYKVDIVNSSLFLSFCLWPFCWLKNLEPRTAPFCPFKRDSRGIFQVTLHLKSAMSDSQPLKLNILEDDCVFLS